MKLFLVFGSALGFLLCVQVRFSVTLAADNPPNSGEGLVSHACSPVQTEGASSTGALGINDRITIEALHVPEISSQPYRIDSSGYITLPLAGRLRAAGLSVHQFEEEVVTQLRPYILEPQVSVTVAEFKSEPISVDGAVKNPGVYQLENNKTLLEALSLSGGVTPEAGDTVKIVRLPKWNQIQLPGAHTDVSGQFNVAETSLRGLMEAEDPAGNVPICPGDVITVPRAPLVYVIGEVHKPGGFMLRDRESSSVLEALSLAEGLTKTAASGSARILRVQPNHSERLEIPVDLGAVLSGKRDNIKLQPYDILLVPNSASKTVLYRSAEATLEMITGVVVWR